MNKKGGRGTCSACGNDFNNVSYHTAHECSMRIKDDMTVNIIKDDWNSVITCNEFTKDANRLSKDEYACMIALSVASRSEDPHTIAGCCILNCDGRIISTGYNGLSNGKSLPSILATEKYRHIKRDIFIHAETNALSLIKKGEGHSIYLNISPCKGCAINIVAHDIKQVVFVKDYAISEEYKNIFKFYGISYRKLSSSEIKNINKFINSHIFIHDETTI